MGRFTAAVDAFQQRHEALAFPIAVWRKFNDDKAGNLAGLVAYYAFLSTFPLLLVLVTVLGVVLAGSPRLQQDVLNSALSEFPVIGTQLRANVHSLGRSGRSLAVGLILTFFGARGVTNAMQNAMNQVWEVPRRARPSFPFPWLRSYALIAVIGLGVLMTTALSGVGSWSGHTILVLGLLAWFHLQAVLTLYAVEADMVRARRLWPRSLFPPPLTAQDREALRSYAEVEQRRPEVRVETHFDDSEALGEE